VKKSSQALVSVIIPGYNEGSIVAGTVAAVEQRMAAMKRRYELLVVDDGSTDKTAEILERLVKSKKHPNLRYVSYPDGPSRRENLAKSFKLLKGDYVLLLDMDLSLDIKHLEEMLYWLEQGYGMVIVNRYHRQSHIRRNLKRYIVSKVYNGVIRFLFRTGFQDNICGFKAFRKDAIMRLVQEAGADPTRKRSVFWDTQILILALRDRIRIKEIPVHWEEAEKSALNFQRESGMIPYILKFWLRGR
jgi:glycosyltransferase AglD